MDSLIKRKRKSNNKKARNRMYNNSFDHTSSLRYNGYASKLKAELDQYKEKGEKRETKKNTEKQEEEEEKTTERRMVLQSE